jgi:hypothetical protein
MFSRLPTSDSLSGGQMMHVSSNASVILQHRLCPGRRFWRVEQKKTMLPGSVMSEKPLGDVTSQRIFSCSQNFAEWRHSWTIVTSDKPRSAFSSPSSTSTRCKRCTRRSCCAEEACALENISHLVPNPRKTTYLITSTFLSNRSRRMATAASAEPSLSNES